MRHVRAVLELLSAVMQDTRFIDAYNGCVAEGRPTNMDPWLDEIENRGREEGRENEIFLSVQEGDYKPKRGAEKLGITEKEFMKRMNAAGYKI